MSERIFQPGDRVVLVNRIDKHEVGETATVKSTSMDSSGNSFVQVNWDNIHLQENWNYIESRFEFEPAYARYMLNGMNKLNEPYA